MISPIRSHESCQINRRPHRESNSAVPVSTQVGRVYSLDSGGLVAAYVMLPNFMKFHNSRTVSTATKMTEHGRTTGLAIVQTRSYIVP